MGSLSDVESDDDEEIIMQFPMYYVYTEPTGWIKVPEQAYRDMYEHMVLYHSVLSNFTRGPFTGRVFPDPESLSRIEGWDWKLRRAVANVQ
jgi:hypothetical protein